MRSKTRDLNDYGSSISTTVAGLGTGVGGRQARLRLGATPFQFIDLIYDSTYAHWISSELPIWTAQWDSDVNVPSAAGMKITTAGAGVTFVALITRYREAAAAGLTLQYRFEGAINLVSGSGAGNAFYYPLWGDVGGSFATGSSLVLGPASIAVGTTSIFDTGWFSPSITTKDIAGINVGFSPNGASVLYIYGTFNQRWIG